MEQSVPPSGPTPPPLPPPPTSLQHSSKDKPKFRRKYIAIAIISVSIIALLSLCVVLGTLILRGYEAKAKEEAKQFIQNALKENYKAQYEQVNPTSFDTMWLFLVCPTEEGGEARTDLPSTEAVLQENYASSTGVLSGMYGGESAKPLIQDGNPSSARVTSINNQTFYVELNYQGATEPFPLIIRRQKNTYSVDFAASLVFGDPTIAERTRQAVESLLEDPTIENCDTAQRLLDKAQALKSELELWLKRGPESILSDTKKAEIDDAIKETKGFKELSSRVEKAREEIIARNTEPKTTASQSTPTSTPTTTTTSPAPSTPSSTPQPKQKSTTDMLWGSLEKAFGSRKGYDLQFDDSSGVAIITRTYGENDLWDENDVVRKGYSLLVKFGMQAFKVPQVSSVEAIVVVPMQDSFGKTSNETAVDLRMTKAEFQKYDWKELEYQAVSPQMQRSCIKYWIYPSIEAKTNPDDLFLEL
jgi:hypothetical protein